MEKFNLKFKLNIINWSYIKSNYIKAISVYCNQIEKLLCNNKYIKT